MGVGALHALLGFALVSGLGVSVVQEVSDNLKAFDVLPVVPEPPELPVEPPKQSLQERSTQSEGAASPANLRQLPTPVPVPVPVVPLPVPPPLVSAPAIAEETHAEAGAAPLSGPGSGSGGAGSGSGSGAAGSGIAGGGVAVHAERVKGRIKNSDYPRSAYDDHASGTVFVRLVVGADGRVSECAIDESSGRADLDTATCRIILERYRYRPARDAAGNPVAETVHMAQVWETGRRR